MAMSSRQQARGNRNSTLEENQDRAEVGMGMRMGMGMGTSRGMMMERRWR